MISLRPRTDAIARWLIAIAAVVVCQTTQIDTATAGIMTFQLHDHPDGNAQLPLYGMRLDGLFSGNGNDVWTFSFDQPGVAAYLAYVSDTNRVVIWGSAYGGLDNGNTANTWTHGQIVEFQFDYRMNVTAAGDGVDFSITVGESDMNNGWIDVSPDGDEMNNQRITLVGFMDPSFLFEHEGPRLVNGNHGDGDHSDWPYRWEGAGWMNHSVVEGGSTNNHIASSDWLFTAVSNPEQETPPVPGVAPEPSSIILLSLGCLGLCGYGYRRRRKGVANAA